MAKGRNTAVKEKIEKARVLYLMTDMSLADIAKEVDLPKSTLYNHSSKERWLACKISVKKDSKLHDIINLNMDSLAFYETVKEEVAGMFEESLENPKDAKLLFDIFESAEKRSNQIRLLEAE